MANWLKFDKIEEWDHLVIPGFQYDYITDEHIAAALEDTEALSKVDTRIDWEDDRWLSQCMTIPDDRKHAYRVAAIVKQLENGGKLTKGISLDTFANGQCCSCVNNGHHRVRALQYMGMKEGPFTMSGYCSLLEDLIRVAGSECPQEFKGYFEDQLILLQPDDTKPRKQRTKRKSSPIPA